MSERISFNILYNQISPHVRVSTAAVPSSTSYGNFWYVETWIFSDDPKVCTRQVIHGTPHCDDPPSDSNCSRIMARARKVHGQIATNLKAKLERRA